MNTLGAQVEADAEVPIIHIRRDFAATRNGEEYAFRGCFHEIGEARIVQTFT